MVQIQRMEHTRTSVTAVQSIKNKIKKEVITLKDIISTPSKELLEKRNYMQSDEFIKDPHNRKFLELSDEMMSLRDQIAEEVTERNKSLKFKSAQAINGLSRFERRLDKDYNLNFNNDRFFYSPTEDKYSFIKNHKL